MFEESQRGHLSCSCSGKCGLVGWNIAGSCIFKLRPKEPELLTLCTLQNVLEGVNRKDRFLGDLVSWVFDPEENPIEFQRANELSIQE